MRFLGEVQRRLKAEMVAQATSSLQTQSPENPELYLGKAIGTQNGLARALEIVTDLIAEEARKEIMAE